MHNLCRLNAEKLLVQQDVSLECAKRSVVIEIAQMMAEESVPPEPKRECRLQLPSHREDRMRALHGQADRRRSEPARTSHQ